MSMDSVRILILIVEEVITLYIAFRAFRNVRRQADDTPAAFFAFAVVSLIVNNFYWIMFSLMYGNMRMPFSVADFSEDGSILLVASVLTSAFPEKEKVNPGIAAGAIIFIVGNIALWICWNGEWAKDILGGLCYAYYVWHAARALWLSRAFARRDWIRWAIGCAALLAAHFIVLLLPARLKPWMDGWAYALMLAGALLLSANTIRAVKAGESRKKAISLAGAGYLWAITCVYMCGEPAWFVAEIAMMIMFILLLQALERREDAL